MRHNNSVVLAFRRALRDTWDLPLLYISMFVTEGWGVQAGHEAALSAYGHASAACSLVAVTSSLHDAVLQQLGMSSEPWHPSGNEARQQRSHRNLARM